MLTDMLFPVPGNSRNTAISKMWRHKCLSLPNIIARLEMGTVQILLKTFKFRFSLPVSPRMLSECWNSRNGKNNVGTDVCSCCWSLANSNDCFDLQTGKFVLKPFKFQFSLTI